MKYQTNAIMKILSPIVLLSCFAYITLVQGMPSELSLGQFYPTKGVTDAATSEVLQCRSIRDVIRRNTARYRNVLIRNDNPIINFGSNEDNRYMTSRAKSKLDVLATRIQSKWGSWMKLQVEKAWTDVIDKNDMLSLHYEGRTLKVKLAGGSNVNTQRNLGQLCGLALVSGFDWVYFESTDYIRISVIPDVCQTKLDMAFVIDGSGSVGITNFGKVKQFLKNIVDFYNVGFDQTRIALVAYSYTVDVAFLLNSYGTKSQIKSAIDRVAFEGSMTATGDALIQMKNKVFSIYNGMRDDKSIPKVGILITDGKSNRGTDVQRASNQVKLAGINMFVIGIGNNLNKDELRMIASDPDDEHLFYYGFNDLSTFVDQMSTTSCDEGAQISQCESAETYVDGGSFKYFRGSFNTGTTGVTIEVEDIQGLSYLYISTSNKNPGPMDFTTTRNSTGPSPRALSIDLSSLDNKLVYISVQGREDSNTFILSIWDSLFTSDKYQKTILENGPADQQVAVIKSSKAGTFEYTIKAGNSAGHFTINKGTGEVRTTRMLDRESIPRYSLVIVAQDVNLRCHKGRTELVVDVGDVNDNGPKFGRNPYQFSIGEKAALQQIVGYVSATDKDSGSNAKLRYSIVAGTGRADFMINPDTGRIHVARALDYERQSSYNLRVRVEDGGSIPKAAEAGLVITIVDVNEAPSFTGDCTSSCSVTIDEGDTSGRQVKQLFATDPDKAVCSLKFSIVSSDRTYFNIDEVSGVITTAKPIDRETKEIYQLQVVVRDCASPPLTDMTTVTVVASDVNDNAPRFPVARYSANVVENQAAGTFVTRTRATDLDKGINARISYSILSGNGDRKFTINAGTGLISTTAPLDRETKDSYQLTVQAIDGGSPSKSSTVIVDVSVGDLNDNGPEFSGVRNFQVTENSGSGTPVGKVLVDDKDTGINGRVHCSIIDGNFANAFSIDAASCEITTVGVIDRETSLSYSLTIKAADLGVPQHSATAIYTIAIQDENDNSPIFTSTTYRAYIKENSPTSSLIIRVSAVDRDAGTNAAITYTITSGDDAVKKFEIDAKTGQITLIAALSFGDRNTYNLRIRAQDGAAQPRTGEADVIITVEDTNDYSPIFNPSTYAKNIPENAAAGSGVVTVTATDQDTGPSGHVSYIIESGNVNNAFVINSQTGQITTGNRLDRETTLSYNLKIRAKDNGSPSKTATADVTVSITDVNDNAPMFVQNPFRFKVQENANLQTSIGKLVATDKDVGINAQLEYELVTRGGPISVDPSNGDVKLTQQLDYETKKSYSFDVKVSDKGNPVLSSYSKLIVEVMDVNDNIPVFGGPFTCEVLENSPASTTVCYVTATDADSGDNAKISYTISPPSTGACPFSIIRETGEIKTTKILDRELELSYTCVVTAVDAGIPAKSSLTRITVTIKDENDNTPVLNPPSYSFDITEEQTSDLSLGRINATDRDTGDNGRLTYTLKASSSILAKFQVDSSSGAVSAKVKLDREAQSSYSFMVRVSDNGQPSLYVDATVDVTVQDINDNTPVFLRSPYTGSIRENSAAGSKIVQVSATDSDAGSNADITYEIADGLFSGNFTIEPKTGFIKTVNPLDFEQLANYTLTIRAKDGGNPSKSSTVKAIVNIINVDDNAPEFGTTSKVEVSEGAVIGTPVVKFNGTDLDGGALRYSIKSGNDGSAFEIDVLSGQLKTKAALDRETKAKYNLTVGVKDASDKETIASVPIIVTDINDNAPKFDKNQYAGNILENRPAGYSILRVRATDLDEGVNSEIEYEIEAGATKDSFTIESNGDIKTSKPFDREQHPIHTLVVVAKDKGKPSLRGKTNVEITVIDENDNAPVIDQVPNKQIAENCGAGATVAVIHANDPDSGINGQIKYTLVSENGAAPTTFEIGENDGVLKTKVNLDRERHDSYTLRIRASDSAVQPQNKSTETSVVVTVTDENDNAPIITSPLTIPEVREDVAVNTVVTKFVATDADLGLNALVEFEIVSGNTDGSFSIDKSTGDLTVVKQLDREHTPSYRIVIKVEDKGKPSLRITKTFQVNVKDVNDNKPEFTLSKFTGSVDENVPIGTNVVNVSATDADVASNAVVSYRFSNPAITANFSINSSTGQITTAANIDYEVKPLYRFNVTATDGDFSTEAEVEIEVINLNDNSPVFEKAYVVSISEDKAVSSSVVTVKANDVDSLGLLTYSLLNNTASFSIDSQTGEIKTTVGLDREKTSFYIIGVQVEDGGKPKLSAVTTVTVNVDDVNDNAPYFNQSSATVEVKENSIVKDFFTVAALDKDSGVNAELEYEIVRGTGSDRFNINPSSGAVSTAAQLDREATSSYTLNIIAKDKGSPSLTSQPFVLSVSVSDVNDNTPYFTKVHDNEVISEGATVGMEVFNAFASDLDIGKNAEIIYSIGGGSNGVFSIDNTTGVVSVKSMLDRETQDIYQLEVVATDRGTPPLSNSTRVSISVTDVNDNSPQFDKSTLIGEILENKPVASLVGKVVATDKDLGENARVTYSLNANDAFAIDRITGEVKTLKELDREEIAQYKLQVTATDNGTVPLSTTEELTINVLDVDDNCPLFSPKVYRATIEENLAYGTIVLSVTATDRDSGTNGELHYAITDGDDRGGFSIDSVTGSIKVFGKVDREYSENYLLKVRAGNIDCGVKQSNESNIGEEAGNQNNYNQSLAEVHIHLTDKNDNAPIFTEKTFYHDFRNVMAKELMNVTARDPDLGEGGKVTYRLMSYERADKSGEERHEVKIEARDNGTPVMKSNTTVVIRNIQSCKKMSFTLTESGKLSTTTLCSFKESPTGSFQRLVGESFSLDCRAEGNDEIMYRWTKDGNSIAAFKKSGLLEIAEVTKDDQGTYECLASNGAGSVSAPTKATLVIKEKPKIFEHPVHATAETGGIIAFKCDAVGDPAPRFQWRKDGEIYQAGEGYNTKTLILRDVILNDAGVYYCEAVNSVGSAESNKVTLKVVERVSVVSLTLSINNPKEDGSCHYFIPSKLEQIIDSLTKKKSSVTKYDSRKFCNVTHCEPNPCENEGKCDLMPKSYYCSCKGGWRGVHCLDDINECNSSIGSCLVGQCNNEKGSYWCSCPVGRTGRSCQYQDSVCRLNPCGNDYICLPMAQTAVRNHTCVPKQQLFVTVVKLKKENGWQNYKQYDIENDLNSALQDWKPKTSAYSNSVDFTSCNIRVTRVQDAGDDLATVEYVFICPGNISRDIPAYAGELCSALLGSMKDTINCQMEGRAVTTKAPVLKIPAIEAVIEIVLKDDTSGKALSADETVDLISNQNVRDQLASQQFTVSKIDQAYVGKVRNSDEKSPGATVALVLGVVAFIVAVALGALYFLRRRRGGSSDAKMTMTERIALRGNSKEDLLRSDLMMSSVNNIGIGNDAYTGDRSSNVPIDESFMINVAGQMRKDDPSAKKSEQYESLPWFKGQMSENEVESSFEACTKPGSYLAYKSDDDLFVAIKTSDEVIHMPIKRTPAGAFLVKYGNNETVARDSLIDIIEHFQVSPLNLGDGTAEVVLTEPWLPTSI